MIWVGAGLAVAVVATLFGAGVAYWVVRRIGND